MLMVCLELPDNSLNWVANQIIIKAANEIVLKVHTKGLYRCEVIEGNTYTESTSCEVCT